LKNIYLIFLIFILPQVLQGEKKKFLSFESNGLYGFKDKLGKVIIKPQFDFANDFTNESIAFVVSKGKWICIDTKNNILLHPYVFDNGPDYYSEGLARYKENNKIGFFNKYCKSVIPANFDFADPFENGYAVVNNECESTPEGEHIKIICRKVGLINQKGKIVVPIEYESIINFDRKRKIVTVKKGNDSINLPFQE
jgi:hypothetical protein